MANTGQPMSKVLGSAEQQQQQQQRQQQRQYQPEISEYAYVRKTQV
ncbi:MAG: hypothetical protein M3115_05965 [Thermoproteota archaeon]|nr:hypothetical protein [Thermoproteota archaeon]